MLAKFQLSPTEWEGEIEQLSSNLVRAAKHRKRRDRQFLSRYISVAGLLLQVRLHNLPHTLHSPHGLPPQLRYQ